MIDASIDVYTIWTARDVLIKVNLKVYALHTHLLPGFKSVFTWNTVLQRQSCYSEPYIL